MSPPHMVGPVHDEHALARRLVEIAAAPRVVFEIVLGTGYVFARLVRASARERARA